MTLTTRLISVKEVRPASRSAMPAPGRAPADSRIGIAAIGYGDGYPRHAGLRHAGPGQRPARGARRPGLDGHGRARPRRPARGRVGTPVTLWGQGLPVETVAAHAGTIAYELLCGLTGRVHIGSATTPEPARASLVLGAGSTRHVRSLHRGRRRQRRQPPRPLLRRPMAAARRRRASWSPTCSPTPRAPTWPPPRPSSPSASRSTKSRRPTPTCSSPWSPRPATWASTSSSRPCTAIPPPSWPSSPRSARPPDLHRPQAPLPHPRPPARQHAAQPGEEDHGAGDAGAVGGSIQSALHHVQ